MVYVLKADYQKSLPPQFFFCLNNFSLDRDSVGSFSNFRAIYFRATLAIEGNKLRRFGDREQSMYLKKHAYSNTEKERERVRQTADRQRKNAVKS